MLHGEVLRRVVTLAFGNFRGFLWHNLFNRGNLASQLPVTLAEMALRGCLGGYLVVFLPPQGLIVIRWGIMCT